MLDAVRVLGLLLLLLLSESQLSNGRLNVKSLRLTQPGQCPLLRVLS